MCNYLKNNDISIKSGTNVNSIIRDMMSILLEGALDEELVEELGYSKYDYHNKETDNSQNEPSKKIMHTSYGDMDVAILRDCNDEYEPQFIKKYQNTVTQDMERSSDFRAFLSAFVMPFGLRFGLWINPISSMIL